MRLLVSLRLRQDDHVAVISLALEVFQGDAVCHTTIEQLVSLHLHDFRRQRHRCRGSQPLQFVVVYVVHYMIYRLARLHIRTNDGKLQGILLEGLDVEEVVLVGNYMITELRIEVVARGQQ